MYVFFLSINQGLNNLSRLFQGIIIVIKSAAFGYLGKIEQGKTTFSDEWKAYSYLNNCGYIHNIIPLIIEQAILEYSIINNNTINHKNNFIDLEAGAETQMMKCF